MGLSPDVSARMVPRALLDMANDDIARLRQQLAVALEDDKGEELRKSALNLQHQVHILPNPQPAQSPCKKSHT